MPFDPLIREPRSHAMTDCIYCGKPLDRAPNDGQEHDACYAEYDKRTENGMCEFCGKNKTDGELPAHFCSDCRKNNRPYVGYPDL